MLSILLSFASFTAEAPLVFFKESFFPDKNILLILLRHNDTLGLYESRCLLHVSDVTLSYGDNENERATDLPSAPKLLPACHTNRVRGQEGERRFFLFFPLLSESTGTLEVFFNVCVRVSFSRMPSDDSTCELMSGKMLKIFMGKGWLLA